CTRGPIPFAYW
nr:immunoglobulin heavy chain junction region [Mus musculus]NSM04841.1 immunoglobulin heavy chain junction region [Mus musculus]NSM07351.1 immunoglobulin heavy chain junction region [Mus musculus]